MTNLLSSYNNTNKMANPAKTARFASATSACLGWLTGYGPLRRKTWATRERLRRRELFSPAGRLQRAAVMLDQKTLATRLGIDVLDPTGRLHDKDAGG